jgi:asparagine synthase (glutamine-hydrolysing)
MGVRDFLSMIRAAGGAEVVAAVRAARLTYLRPGKLAGICTTVDRLRRTGVAGDYIEAGCALGGSAIVIGTLRPPEAEFRIHDVFGMIPPPTAEDPPEVIARYETILAGKSGGIGGDTYYGYIADLEEVVAGNLARHLSAAQRARIRLVKGLLQDTLHPEGPVAFAHVDVDWYDPVRVSLERIVPKLAPGGVVILDDYFDWGGCRKAADEYLASPPVRLRRETRFGNLILTRLQGGT